MENNKISSIEWLFPKVLELTLQLSNKRISQRSCELKILELFEQGKAMHKEEIMESVKYGFNKEYYTPNYRDQQELFEQYYNETFGGNNEQQ